MTNAQLWYWLKRQGLSPEDVAASSLLTGLADSWLFDNLAGGTYTGVNGAVASVTGATEAPLLFGTALSFNGTTNRLQIPDEAKLRGGVNPWSMAAFVSLTDLTGVRPIIGKLNAGINYEYLVEFRDDIDVGSGPGKGLHCQVFDGGGSSRADAKIAYDPGGPTPFLVTAGFDPAAGANGSAWIAKEADSPVYAAASAAPGTSTAPLYVGYRPDGGGGLAGKILAPAFWNDKVMTSAERAWLNNGGAGRIFPWAGGP